MIIVGSQAAGLKAGAASLRHTRIGRPSMRPGTKAHREHRHAGCGPLRTIFGRCVVASVRGEAGALVKHRVVSPRLNLRRPFKASGSLRPFGYARFKFLQEPSRCIRQAFHVRFLSTAPLDRHQRSERAFPNDGKSGARPGNLTARGGKNAC